MGMLQFTPFSGSGFRKSYKQSKSNQNIMIVMKLVFIILTSWSARSTIYDIQNKSQSWESSSKTLHFAEGGSK